MLMIVGGGPYLEILRKKAAELGVMESVIFTGMVSPEEVASYYPAGDLFISASTSETQGLTYADALAAGLPLLCRKDECLRAGVQKRLAVPDGRGIPERFEELEGERIR